MKKSLVSIFAFFSLFLCHHISSGQLKAGIKGGLNLSNFYINDNVIRLNNYKTGYHAGIFIRLNVTGWLGLQQELYFNTKGRSGEIFNYHLSYIDFPLLITLNFFQKFNLHFGPYTSILVDGIVISDLPAFIGDFNRNSFRKLDYGFSLGSALEFKRINLGLRYSWGLTEVATDYRLYGKLFNIGEARNSVWQIYMAINIIGI